MRTRSPIYNHELIWIASKVCEPARAISTRPSTTITVYCPAVPVATGGWARKVAPDHNPHAIKKIKTGHREMQYCFRINGNSRPNSDRTFLQTLRAQGNCN